jgi:flagellar M-ring protein FliF
LARYFQAARAQWEKFPRLARWTVTAVALGLVALCIWLVTNADQAMYEPLYDQPMELSQAGQIREHLESTNVPYRIKGDGTILVPRDRKLALRMELASEGLQPEGTTGFELFDEQRFGASDFEQRVNFRRALEGEMARTIRTLEAVESSRVHLNLPRRSLYRSEDVAPSASVVLRLRRGTVLGRKRVVGIQELVARSVERLAPDRVAVLDDSGRLLSQDHDEAGGAMALDYQRRYEAQLERRVEEILERTIGLGRTEVRVAAQFDFSRMEETQEHYDPERSVIRSEQLVSESEGAGAEQPGGVPGVRSNLPGGPGPKVGGSGAAAQRQSETRNYEVDKVVRRVLSPVARLKRQSLAVLVDGRWEQPEEGAEGAAAEKQFVPRNEEELAQLSSLVKRAVGFDAERGDSVDVQSLPFVAPGLGGAFGDEAVPSPWPWWANWVAVATVVALLLAVLLWSRRRKKSAESDEQLPKTVKEMEAELQGGVLPEQLQGAAEVGEEGARPGALPGEVDEDEGAEAIRRQVINLAVQEPAAAARIIRAWLAEDGGEQPHQES